MVFDEETKKKATIFFIVVLVLGLLAYSTLKYGAVGFKGVFTGFIKLSITAMVLGGIVFVGYKIFFTKPEINLVEQGRKDIVEAGILTKPPLIRDLYFTGDKEHGESKIGRIIGFCQIQNYEKAKEGEAVEEDCFIFKKFKFPLSLFEKPKVFRCYPQEHSQLVGDVRVFAVSPIFKYGYFYPNNAYLNVRRIDASIVREAWRDQMFETLKDLATITKKAAGLDSEQAKSLEHRKLLKIPSPLSEEESRGFN